MQGQPATPARQAGIFAVRVFITLVRPRHDFLVGCLGEIGKLAHTRDYGARGSVSSRV